MKRLTQIGLCCAVMALGWLLGACAPTPTAPAVDPSLAGLSANLEAPSSLPNGEAIGGRGLTSLEISDLDEDGIAELLFTYGLGSGIHQSRIGMYAPVDGPDRAHEAGTGYFGDLGLVKEGKSTVKVRVVA